MTTSKLWNELAASKKFREEFNALQLKRGLPFQVRALLKSNNWTQEQLAEASGLTQGVVSRVQNPNYGNLTINTIARIAAGFDLAFIGKFVPFSALIEWFENLSEEEAGNVESFAKEHGRIKRGNPQRSMPRKRRSRKRLAVTCIRGPIPSINATAGAEQLQFEWPKPQEQSENINRALRPSPRMRGESSFSRRFQAPIDRGKKQIAGGLR